jgi:hypothetical protein
MGVCVIMQITYFDLGFFPRSYLGKNPRYPVSLSCRRPQAGGNMEKGKAAWRERPGLFASYERGGNGSKRFFCRRGWTWRSRAKGACRVCLAFGGRLRQAALRHVVQRRLLQHVLGQRIQVGRRDHGLLDAR